MAVQLPPEMVENELMAKSVMDEPRSGFQRLRDFLVGRTLGEQVTGTFTGLAPLTVKPVVAATAAAKEVVPESLIRRMVRSMGRENMQAIRAKGGPAQLMTHGESPPSTFKGYQAYADFGPKNESILSVQTPWEVHPNKLAWYPNTTPEQDLGEVLKHEAGHLQMMRAYQAGQDVTGGVPPYAKELMKKNMGQVTDNPIIEALANIPAGAYTHAMFNTPKAQYLEGARALRTLRGLARAKARGSE